MEKKLIKLILRCALPLYETTVREDLQHGSCILEVFIIEITFIFTFTIII